MAMAIATQKQRVDQDPSPGGYNVLMSTIPKQHKCPFCSLLMRDPIQTYRGERACESCYVNGLKTSKGLCPIDGEEIKSGEVFFQDRAARRDILQLECYCPNKLNKCQWIGTVNTIENHSIICEFKNLIQCIYCHEEVLEKDHRIHITEKCKFSKNLYACCNVNTFATSILNHMNGYAANPMLCPYKCGHSMSVHVPFRQVENSSDTSSMRKGKNSRRISAARVSQSRSINSSTNTILSDILQVPALGIAIVTNLQQTNMKLTQDLLRAKNIRRGMENKFRQASKDLTVLTDECQKIKDEVRYDHTEDPPVNQISGDAEIKENVANKDTILHVSNLQRIQSIALEIKGKYKELLTIYSGGGGEGGIAEEEEKKAEKRAGPSAGQGGKENGNLEGWSRGRTGKRDGLYGDGGVLSKEIKRVPDILDLLEQSCEALSVSLSVMPSETSQKDDIFESVDRYLSASDDSSRYRSVGHATDNNTLPPSICPDCNDFIVSNDVKQHRELFCGQRRMACQYCDQVFTVRELQNHHQECPSKSFESPYQCSEDISSIEVVKKGDAQTWDKDKQKNLRDKLGQLIDCMKMEVPRLTSEVKRMEARSDEAILVQDLIDKMLQLIAHLAE